jgi:DGQHR domain-containing protein
MPIITRPAALVRQGSLKLFTTSLRVSDLRVPNFYTITHLDPSGDGQGYQRVLNETRAKRLSEYLVDGHSEKDAFLPTSIFLATSKSIEFDSATNTITFDSDAVGPFNVVDGQHRIAGLVAAAEREPSLRDFEVPVNIAVNLDDVSQMCHFLIVNTTQKSVDKAVEQQIVARLTAMIGVENVPRLPRWIKRQVDRGEDARALAVARFLNEDGDSPWKGRIRMANEEAADDTTINQKSFVKSLKQYIFAANHPLSGPDWDEKRNKILRNYWRAISDLLIDPDSEKDSVVFKTIGVDLFHLASASVFARLMERKNFQVDAVKALLTKGLKNLPADSAGMAHAEWWQSGNEASGINSAAMRRHAAALSQALNVADGPGDIEV